MRPDRSLVRAPLGFVLAIPVVAVVLLVGVAVAGGDRAVFLRVSTLSNLLDTAVWTRLTILGDGLVCAVLMVPWMRRHPERAWGALLGAIVMVVVLRLFKELLSIPRPLAVLGADAFTLIGPGHRRSSFPSGHAATVFLYAGAWIQAQRRPRWGLSLLVPAAAVSVSRVVVGVHWPSDVLAGALLGWTSAWIGLRWAGRGRRVLAGADRLLAGALIVAAVVLMVVDHTGYRGVLGFQRGIGAMVLAWGVATLWSRTRVWALASHGADPPT